MELKEYIKQGSNNKYQSKSIGKATAIESVLNKISNRSNISCLPIDEPKHGQSGFIIWWQEDGEEHTLDITRQFRDKATVIKHDTYAEANAAYKDAVEKNYLIERADNPKQIIVGWIVTKGDGIEHHQLRVYKLKEV